MNKVWINYFWESGYHVESIHNTAEDAVRYGQDWCKIAEIEVDRDVASAIEDWEKREK